MCRYFYRNDTKMNPNVNRQDNAATLHQATQHFYADVLLKDSFTDLLQAGERFLKETSSEKVVNPERPLGDQVLKLISHQEKYGFPPDGAPLVDRYVVLPLQAVAKKIEEDEASSVEPKDLQAWYERVEKNIRKAPYHHSPLCLSKNGCHATREVCPYQFFSTYLFRLPHDAQQSDASLLSNTTASPEGWRYVKARYQSAVKLKLITAPAAYMVLRSYKEDLEQREDKDVSEK